MIRIKEAISECHTFVLTGKNFRFCPKMSLTTVLKENKCFANAATILIQEAKTRFFMMIKLNT